MGEFPTVIVHNYDGVRQIFNRTEFDGRPDVFAARLRDPLFNKRGIYGDDMSINVDWFLLESTNYNIEFQVYSSKTDHFGKNNDDLF